MVISINLRFIAILFFSFCVIANIIAAMLISLFMASIIYHFIIKWIMIPPRSYNYCHTKEAAFAEDLSDAITFAMFSSETYFNLPIRATDYRAHGCIHMDGAPEGHFIKKYCKYFKLSEIEFSGSSVGVNYVARLFQSNSGDEIIVSFRGTGIDRIADISADVNQFLGMRSSYYEWAVRTARNIIEDNRKSKIIFTGHSLGGGLATVAALATNRQAYVYNPAGLNYKTLHNLEISSDSEYNIHAYISSSINQNTKINFVDIVSGIGLIGLNRTYGYIRMIPLPPEVYLKGSARFYGLPNPLYFHSVDALTAGMIDVYNAGKSASMSFDLCKHSIGIT